MVLDISSGGDMVSCQIGFRDLEVHLCRSGEKATWSTAEVRFSFQRLGPSRREAYGIPALTGIKSGPGLLVALPMCATRTPAAQTLWQFASNSAHEQNLQRE